MPCECSINLSASSSSSLERSLDKRGAAAGDGASVEAGLDILDGWKCSRFGRLVDRMRATPCKTEKCERKSRAKPEMRRKRASRWLQPQERLWSFDKLGEYALSWRCDSQHRVCKFPGSFNDRISR